MTKRPEDINLVDRIEEGVTFLDGVCVYRKDFETEDDFTEAIVSEFVHRLNLDTDRYIFSPIDGQVLTAIESMGWRLHISERLHHLFFDQKRKDVWITEEMFERDALKIVKVYALIGVFFLEKTKEGQAIMNSDDFPMIPNDEIFNPSHRHPREVVMEILSALSRHGVVPDPRPLPLG